MNPNGQTKVKYLLLLTVLLLILPAGCGYKDSAEVPANTKYSALTELKSTAEGAAAPVSEPTRENTAAPAAPSSESKGAAVIEYKFAFRVPFEGIILKNHRLQECVYEQLGKADGTPLYEEELAAYRGLLRRPDYYSFTITNGQELDFVRTYFDLNSFYDFSITFSPDLHDWIPSQLEGLKDLQKPVRVSGTEDTIPAEVLVFFTGTDKLIFDNIADVTGTLPPGKTFPDTVREVTLLSWSDAPYTYENLFACMQDSNVEYLHIPHYSNDLGYAFPLDDVTGMKALVSLDLSGGRIRVENKECLSGSSLKDLMNFILDGETDISIFQMLPQLTYINCDVTADADLSFVLGNETLSLRLFFCPPAIEYSSYYPELYPDCTPAVFPALDDALGWREDGDENNFLAIYQRFIDEGRIIECFSVRYLTHREDYYPMQNVRTFLRVTDGKRTQQFSPEPLDSEFATFGSYQTDPVCLVDINFDGINDITLDSGSFGNSLHSFEYAWIYNPASGLYLPSNSFQCITNPSVDGEHQLVRSSWRINAASHGWAIYRYDENTGEYRMERQLIEDDATCRASELMPDSEIPENGTLWEWEETVYDKDKETVLEKEYYYAIDAPGLQTEYPDAYYRFHEPDSYWGY